jgi:hypothetical protein
MEKHNRHGIQRYLELIIRHFLVKAGMTPENRHYLGLTQVTNTLSRVTKNPKIFAELDKRTAVKRFPILLDVVECWTCAALIVLSRVPCEDCP